MLRCFSLKCTVAYLGFLPLLPRPIARKHNDLSLTEIVNLKESQLFLEFPFIWLKGLIFLSAENQIPKNSLKYLFSFHFPPHRTAVPLATQSLSPLPHSYTRSSVF